MCFTFPFLFFYRTYEPNINDLSIPKFHHPHSQKKFAEFVDETIRVIMENK